MTATRFAVFRAAGFRSVKAITSSTGPTAGPPRSPISLGYVAVTTARFTKTGTRWNGGPMASCSSRAPTAGHSPTSRPRLRCLRTRSRRCGRTTTREDFTSTRGPRAPAGSASVWTSATRSASCTRSPLGRRAAAAPECYDSRDTAMASERRSVLREGIVAGLIGAAVVAVWFFAYDIARGRPFHTPRLLGAFVFHRVDTPAGVEPAAVPLLGDTVLLGLAFISLRASAARPLAVSV